MLLPVILYLQKTKTSLSVLHIFTLIILSHFFLHTGIFALPTSWAAPPRWYVTVHNYVVQIWELDQKKVLERPEFWSQKCINREHSFNFCYFFLFGEVSIFPDIVIHLIMYCDVSHPSLSSDPVLSDTYIHMQTRLYHTFRLCRDIYDWVSSQSPTRMGHILFSLN